MTTAGDDRGLIAKRIGELRRLMQDAKDLSEIENYFHSSLVSDDAVIRIGIDSSNDVLVSLVRGVLKATFAETQPIDTRFKHLPQHGLWHGMLLYASGAFAQVLYFEDVNRGLISVGGLSGGRCHYLRFSMPEGMDSVDPDTVRLAHFSRRTSGGGNN